MVNSVGLNSASNYQTAYKRENIAFAGEKEKSSKSLSSGQAAQIASFGVGIAGLVALLKTRKLTNDLESKLGKVYSELGLESPKVRGAFAKVGEMFENISSFATRDALTGLSNRKTFDVALKKAVNSAKENGTDMSVSFMDIDFFKRFNDTLGHNVGDKVLKSFAKILDDVSKEHPGLVRTHRCGGEEFGVIMQTNQDDAEKIITKIRDRFANDETIQGFKQEFLDTLSTKIQELNVKKEPAENIIKALTTKESVDVNDLMQQIMDLLPANLNHSRDIKTCIKCLNRNPEEALNIMTSEKYKPLANLISKYAQPEDELKELQKWSKHMESPEARFTLSAGIAGDKVLKDLISKGTKAEDLSSKMLEGADCALYQAKESGRNSHKVAEVE